MRPACLVLAALLAATTAAGDEKVDVVVLSNASRIVGEVRSMKRGRLELKTDDMGTVQIEWENIASVTAPGLFEVEDMGGRLRFGALRPSTDGRRLEIVNSDGVQVLPLPEVARLHLVKSTFWDRISGSLDLGASYESASELLQLDVDGDARFRRPKFEVAAEASAVFTRQPDSDDTRRSTLSLAYNRLFSNSHRILAQGAFEQNRELGYDRRASLKGGWARHLARSTRSELLGGAGLAVNREVPIEGEATTNVEALVSFSYANFAYDFPNTDIQVDVVAYLGLNQWGRGRVEANVRLSREVFKDFYVGVRGYESYDSQPATEGAEKNDWGLTLTLGVRF